MMIQAASESPELTDLERTVLETAFSAAGMAIGFGQQVAAASVASRIPSGVGFVTKLNVSDEFRVSADAAALPVVKGEHPALPSGAEFILQVKNGRINSIEAFCHEGMWPADESQFRIHAGP